jgi:aspartate-semialdehyde dehydrogenase
VKRGKFVDHPVELLANCARMPVIDGHLEAVTLRTAKDANVGDMIKALESFTAEPQKLKLATAPRSIGCATASIVPMTRSARSATR